jgi:hypothetical protein
MKSKNALVEQHRIVRASAVRLQHDSMARGGRGAENDALKDRGTR